MILEIVTLKIVQCPLRRQNCFGLISFNFFLCYEIFLCRFWQNVKGCIFCLHNLFCHHQCTSLLCLVRMHHVFFSFFSQDHWSLSPPKKGNHWSKLPIIVGCMLCFDPSSLEENNHMELENPILPEPRKWPFSWGKKMRKRNTFLSCNKPENPFKIWPRIMFISKNIFELFLGRGSL